MGPVLVRSWDGRGEKGETVIPRTSWLTGQRNKKKISVLLVSV